MKLMSEEGLNFIVAGALLSISLNPLAFNVVGRWIKTKQLNETRTGTAIESKNSHS